MKIAVIGAGLIGAAAAKYLAQAGVDVTLFGPTEPGNTANYSGPFASHYDEGRITRSLDASPFWAQAANASISRYRTIEAASRIAFYTPVGILIAGPNGSETVRQVIATAQHQGTSATLMDGDGLSKQFPYFAFAPSDCGVWEQGDAGHISPRRLVQAQIALAQAAGAHWHKVAVDHVAPKLVHVGKQVHRFDRVLVAAGGYSDSLLGGALSLDVFARTVAFFEVSAETAHQLSTQPSLIYYDTQGRDPYLLPPIRYPDGRYYLKLGGDNIDVKLGSSSEISDWFRSGGNPEVRDILQDHFHQRMPKIKVNSYHMAACVTTFDRSDLPVLRPLEPDLYVATAGSGRAAKSSDELGRLAALMVLDQARPSWAQCLLNTT